MKLLFVVIFGSFAAFDLYTKDTRLCGLPLSCLLLGLSLGALLA